MPWYKLTADHGPGHQSTTKEYFWVSRPLSKGEKEDYFDYYCSDMESPIAEIQMVKKLPEKVKKEQLDTMKTKIEYAKEIIKVLAKTETLKEK